jgi:hypothetical protein
LVEQGVRHVPPEQDVPSGHGVVVVHSALVAPTHAVPAGVSVGKHRSLVGQSSSALHGLLHVANRHL